MKTLVVTTGKDNQIMETWLPTIVKGGQYEGDILLLDYDMLHSSLEFLKQDPTIIVKKVEKVHKDIASDRMRAFYECLKDMWQNYDVILIADGDLEFFKPIAPLFEMAKEKVCYVKEPIYLHSNCQDNDRFHYNQFKFPDAEKIWKAIQNESMINVGMFVGPAKMIYDILGWIIGFYKYDNHWGADQVLFNALIYYYKIFPSQNIDIEWNWLTLNGYARKDDKCYNGIMMDGKCVAGEKEISILHNVGTTYVLFREKKSRIHKPVIPKIFEGVKYSRPPKFEEQK